MKKLTRRFDTVPVCVVLEKARPIEEDISAAEPQKKDARPQPVPREKTPRTRRARKEK